jgi:hypothetical protein
MIPFCFKIKKKWRLRSEKVWTLLIIEMLIPFTELLEIKTNDDFSISFWTISFCFHEVVVTDWVTSANKTRFLLFIQNKCNNITDTLSDVDRSVHARTDVHFFEATFESCRPYGVEGWTLTIDLTNQMSHQLDGTYTQMLRVVFGGLWKQHKRSYTGTFKRLLGVEEKGWQVQVLR